MKISGFPIAALLLGGLLYSNHAYAEGALAVGQTDDVARDGYAYGYVNNRSSFDDARASALNSCRTADVGAPKANKQCKVLASYQNQCLSVSMDPGRGTPGVGWAIAALKQDAEAESVRKCEATAGPGRAGKCVVDHSACDGTADVATAQTPAGNVGSAASVMQLLNPSEKPTPSTSSPNVGGAGVTAAGRLLLNPSDDPGTSRPNGHGD